MIVYIGILWCKRKYAFHKKVQIYMEGKSLLVLEIISQPVKKLKLGYHKAQF